MKDLELELVYEVLKESDENVRYGREKFQKTIKCVNPVIWDYILNLSLDSNRRIIEDGNEKEKYNYERTAFVASETVVESLGVFYGVIERNLQGGFPVLFKDDLGAAVQNFLVEDKAYAFARYLDRLADEKPLTFKALSVIIDGIGEEDYKKGILSSKIDKESEAYKTGLAVTHVSVTMGVIVLYKAIRHNLERPTVMEFQEAKGYKRKNWLN